jgi:hypothetical protein
VADPTIFRSGRDFAAWIGLVPRQDSTGGKQKLGPISKQGDRYLRRILVVGAIAVLRRVAARPIRGTEVGVAWCGRGEAHEENSTPAISGIRQRVLALSRSRARRRDGSLPDQARAHP